MSKLEFFNGGLKRYHVQMKKINTNESVTLIIKCSKINEGG